MISTNNTKFKMKSTPTYSLISLAFFIEKNNFLLKTLCQAISAEHDECYNEVPC